MGAASDAQRIAPLKLICLLKLRQKVRRPDAVKAGLAAIGDGSSAGGYADSRDAAADDRRFGNAVESKLLRRLLGERVLHGRRVVASPTQPKLIHHVRTNESVPADGCRLPFHAEATIGRRAGAIQNPAEDARNVAEAIHVGVTHKDAVSRARSPVDTRSMAVGVVDDPRRADEVELVERA